MGIKHLWLIYGVMVIDIYRYIYNRNIKVKQPVYGKVCSLLATLLGPMAVCLGICPRVWTTED